MGLTAEVVEVKNLEQVDSLGSTAQQDRLFNGAMDPTQINTFNAYGKAAGQRYGALRGIPLWGARRPGPFFNYPARRYPPHRLDRI